MKSAASLLALVLVLSALVLPALLAQERPARPDGRANVLSG